MYAAQMLETLKKEGLKFYTGVPDSTLKPLLKLINDAPNDELTHIPAVNECHAIAMAAGYYMATEEIPVVYMQNAGLGKAVNPLTSLTHKTVYRIPMVLIIGWRGQERTGDAAQHIQMGKIMLDFLTLMDIKFSILNNHDTDTKIHRAMRKAKQYKQPTALLVRRGLFDDIGPSPDKSSWHRMSRADAINTILDEMPDSLFVSTTGLISRDLYNIRKERHEQTNKDFYMVGSMGCAAPLAFGMANKIENQICVLDGDGAALMELGALATTGSSNTRNLCHIIFDNSSYDSTGGQQSISHLLDLTALGHGFGYDLVYSVTTIKQLEQSLREINEKQRLALLIIQLRSGDIEKSHRPKLTPEKNKQQFMEALKQCRKK